MSVTAQKLAHAVPAPRAAPSQHRGLKPPWPKGVSGNPSGHSGLYGETVRLARQAAPAAMRRLIELIDDPDPRVATVASNAVLDRAFGKSKEMKEEEAEQCETEVELSKLSPEHKQLLL